MAAEQINLLHPFTVQPGYYGRKNRHCPLENMMITAFYFKDKYN